MKKSDFKKGKDRLLEWYDQQGWEAFEFQQTTWRAYTQRKSGLIHSPTGTGKTLAAWGGPLIEALADNQTDAKSGQPGIKVMWITPLRALANDTLKSLRAPVKALGLPWRVEARTGDTASSIKAKQRRQLPDALVTTPESLSLFLSYPESMSAFADLRAVVVDEWHELLGSKRGVQTELGLARLRALVPDLVTWGISATLGNTAKAMDVLLGAPSSNSKPQKISAKNGKTRAKKSRPKPQLIQGQLPKAIEVESIIPENIERFPWSGHLGLKLLQPVLEALEKAKTTLVFTNTRAQSEKWYEALELSKPEWREQIGLHHGSMSRSLRAQFETDLAAGKLRAVVCTSSLDLGVDFTPVDQVIQIGSPKGVARLLQRAGRSGHRFDAVSRVLGVPTNAFELIEFAAAYDSITRREIEDRTPLEKPLDLLVQHVVSLALTGECSPEELFDEAKATYAFRNLTSEEWQWVLRFVMKGGDALKAYPKYQRVEYERGKLSVPSKRVARSHRMSIGTITSDSALEVKFANGTKLGSIEERFLARLNKGDVFLFSGRPLEFIRFDGMKVIVKRTNKKPSNVPHWMGGRMPLSSRLSRAVQLKIQEASDGKFFGAEMEAMRPLLEVQGRWSILPQPEELLIEMTPSREGHHVFLFPFGGRIVHEGMAALVAHRLVQQEAMTITTAVTDYGLELLCSKELPPEEDFWRQVLSGEDLLVDLLSCLNASELARRRFRDVARVAGLISTGYPSNPKSSRQLQASSQLLYDVFLKYDPQNLLLHQARREVLEEQLEFERLSSTLDRLAESTLVIKQLERLTPFAFPIWAERIREQTTSSEKFSDRLSRMTQQLEKVADQ
jgi:ATP-dependent Lhr-like helicase